MHARAAFLDESVVDSRVVLRRAERLESAAIAGKMLGYWCGNGSQKLDHMRLVDFRFERHHQWARVALPNRFALIRRNVATESHQFRWHDLGYGDPAAVRIHRNGVPAVDGVNPAHERTAAA
jgi:hypothetical protein